LVAHAEVAADQPVAAELRLGGRLVLPVTEEHHRIRPPVGDAAHLPRGQLAAALVDDADGVPGNGGAGPARPYRRQRRSVADDEVALGLAVELVDGEPERAAAPLDQVLAQALASGGEAAQPHARIARSGRAQELQRGGWHEDVAHA